MKKLLYLVPFIFLLLPQAAYASRVTTIGTELDTCNANLELSNCGSGAALSSSFVHTGKFSLKNTVAGSSAADNWYQYAASASGTTTVYARAYVYITSYDSSASTTKFTLSQLLYSYDEGLGDGIGQLVQDSQGNLGLELCNATVCDKTDVATTTTSIPLNSWHYVEIECSQPSTGNTTLIGKLDGVTFQTLSTTTSGFNSAIQDEVDFGFGHGLLGNNGVLYDDDIAINDGTGNNQNTFPGPGNDLLYVPAGTGDSNTWKTTTGAPGTSNNFSLVFPYPLGTTPGLFVEASTTLASDFYKVSASSTLGQSYTIPVVQFGLQQSRSAANNPAVAIQVEKTSAGTVAKSPPVTPNSTTYNVNQNAIPFNPLLTLYNDPDGTPWTPTTVASMQIGPIVTTVGTTGNTRVPAIWAYVEYLLPQAVQATFTGNAQSIFMNGKEMITFN